MNDTVKYLSLDQNKSVVNFSSALLHMWTTFLAVLLSKKESVYCKIVPGIQLWNIYCNATANLESLTFLLKGWNLEQLDYY